MHPEESTHGIFYSQGGGVVKTRPPKELREIASF